jgi:hypothetical protein
MLKWEKPTDPLARTTVLVPISFSMMIPGDSKLAMPCGKREARTARYRGYYSPPPFPTEHQAERRDGPLALEKVFKLVQVCCCSKLLSVVVVETLPPLPPRSLIPHPPFQSTGVPITGAAVQACPWI